MKELPRKTEGFGITIGAEGGNVTPRTLSPRNCSPYPLRLPARFSTKSTELTRVPELVSFWRAKYVF